jgi:hypothetical protein
MKRIPLTQGKSAIIDNADFAVVSRFKWYALNVKGIFYAVRNVRGERRGTVFMHRDIMRTPPGKETDHRNGDGLDNRRRNLKICTHAENGANRPRVNRNNTTGSRGVYRKADKWQAQIMRNGKSIYLGLFSRKSDAVAAVKKAL